MHESGRNRLVNEIRRFRLAQVDMRQVIASASYLIEESRGGSLDRALETAGRRVLRETVQCEQRRRASWRRMGTAQNVPGPPRGALTTKKPGLRTRTRRRRGKWSTSAKMLGLGKPAYTEGWLFYGVVSSQIETALEVFLERKQADVHRRGRGGRAGDCGAA